MGSRSPTAFKSPVWAEAGLDSGVRARARALQPAPGAARLAADEACRRDALRAHPEIDAQAHPLLSLPSCRRETTPLHEDRRRHFESILDARLRAAAADPCPPDPARPAEPPPLPHTDILGHACALCRGACCTSSGDHANLDVATLQRVRREHPHWSDDELRQAYVGRLPERSTERSCIFHGERGCTLTRELRAAACNFLLCDGLQQLRGRIEARGTPQSALAVVRSHGYWPSPGEPPSRIIEVHRLGEDGAESL